MRRGLDPATARRVTATLRQGDERAVMCFSWDLGKHGVQGPTIKVSRRSVANTNDPWLAGKVKRKHLVNIVFSDFNQPILRVLRQPLYCDRMVLFPLNVAPVHRVKVV